MAKKSQTTKPIRPRPGAVFVELNELQRTKLEMLRERYNAATQERGTLAGVIRRLIVEAK